MSLLDPINLKKMIDEKFISVQKHPTEDLYIYNYTQKTQYAQEWNNETLNCRGLIMTGDGKIVARPFKKFFNLSEVLEKGEQLPAEDFLITEKWDGSLGILYWIGSTPYLATRGSFVSEQAVRGSAMLTGLTEHFDPEKIFSRQYTYLFEIIYPENRIVVDYGKENKLVLLSVIVTETGKEQSWGGIMDYAPYMNVVKRLEGIKDFSKIESKPNAEGYVITFANGNKYKVKFDEYVRLHRLITGINARRIWELLMNKQSFDEVIERVPDEFFQWVKNTKERIQEEFAQQMIIAEEVVAKARKLPTRKEQADFIINGPTIHDTSISFYLLDGKQEKAEAQAWKIIKPKHETPFKIEI